MSKPAIVVAGDVSLDWLCFPVESGQEVDRRTLQGGARIDMPVVHGGAWWLESAIRTLLRPEDNDGNVFGYNRMSTDDLRAARSQFITHSLTNFASFPAHAGVPGLSVLRTPEADFPRYFGPTRKLIHPVLLPSAAKGDEARYKDAIDLAEDIAQLLNADPGFPRVLTSPTRFGDGDRSRIVAILDRGEGFSTHKYLVANPSNDGPAFKQEPNHNWTHLLPTGPAAERISAVVLATSNCSAFENLGHEQDVFWRHLKESGYLDKLVIVLEVADLRNAGVRVSRNESWERSAFDLASQLDRNPLLKQLTLAGHLVVRFGVSGAFYFNRASGSHHLFFDPYCSEGEYRDEPGEGRMFDYDVVVAATLCSGLWKSHAATASKGRSWTFKRDEVCSLIQESLGNARSFFRHGWGQPRDDIRTQVERWDTKASRAVNYCGSARRVDRRISIVSTFPPDLRYEQESDGEGNEARRVEVKLQVDMNDDFESVGTLLSPTIVIEHALARLASECKRHLCDAYDQLEGTSERPFQVEPAAVEQRIGKGIITLECELPEEWKDKCRLYSAIQGKVDSGFRRYCGDVDVENLNPEDDDRRKAWLKRFHGVLSDALIQWHEPISQDLHWNFDAPVTIVGIRERADIKSVRVSGGRDWSILDPADEGLPTLARKIVREGVLDALKTGASDDVTTEFAPFPVVQFGRLWCIDRREIESYRSIKKLIENYCRSKTFPRPLCIGVFGPPGSGKSFGVKQIASGVRGSDDGIYEYNLSQFTRPDDLSDAFIRVRNQSEEDVVPLVFLDEFDCHFERNDLGWLKYFLSVMQDGKFRFKSDELNIGSAILVFAGGTSHSYSEFQGVEERRQSFVDAKGPDFVSRLRGYVDVVGINPPSGADTQDKAYMIRRALILRSLVERYYPTLLDSAGVLRIDGGVLDALLEVPTYQHGARSLEAILEMSSLQGQRQFHKSSLPSAEQLQLHIGEPESNRNVVGRFMEILSSN